MAPGAQMDGDDFDGDDNNGSTESNNLPPRKVHCHDALC